jgi:phospholipase C
VAAGTLPDVTYVDPAMHHDPQNDDHPIADMYRGQLFIEEVYHALRSNPAIWDRTLLIITYDEHGGFYDHVIPPIADARTRPLQMSDGGGGTGHFTPDTVITPYGVRVPAFVVSPWVPPGKGPDIVLDHCSIIKTILARFCGEGAPFLSDRVSASQSFEAYLTETAPRDLPLPQMIRRLPADEPIRRTPEIVTAPLFSRTMRDGNVDFHDLTGMLARMLGRGSAHPVA